MASLAFLAILSLLAALCVSAVDIPKAAAALEPRYPYANGGWGLMTNVDACPTGTYQIDSGGGYQHCCPNGMTAPGNSLACCVDNADCSEALASIPFCADSTWSLWNSTTQNFFFCCTGTEIGLQDGSCVNGATEVAATLSAASLGQPTPVGAGAKTFSASSTSGASAITSLTATPTYTATTSTIDLKSLVSSAIPGATSTISKNDAVTLTPLSLKLLGSSTLMWGTVLAGALGFGFMLLHA